MIKIALLIILSCNFAFADTVSQRKLGDGTISPAVVTLTSGGEIVDQAPNVHLDDIGSAKGYYPNLSRGFVFGKRTLIGNTSVDLWEGPTARYVFPIAPIQMQVVSSDNTGDIPGGIGAREVMIHYLDAKYQAQIITVILNGTTPVLTSATDILRINALHVTAAGSNFAPVGNISVQAVGGAVTYGYISAGFITARQAIYTVPDGYWGYIKHWQASSGSAGNHFAQISLTATVHDGYTSPNIFLLQDETGSQNSGNEINFPIPIPIPPRTDVKISAISDAANANVTALGAIMGWFEKIQ